MSEEENGEQEPQEAEEPYVKFEPMLPKLYELLLPSLDARLNFVNAGQKHAAFFKYVYGQRATCSHAEILCSKTKLLTAIVAKLMDINGILEEKDESG
ncbi:DNA packaging protein UL33 [Aotine betaherpesvirus 1]|uniref:DNA packaging protein UL33 n=1 Tax=Aotine betaherpesvirus 1 TaxID=50290 RepID=G8XUC7_9BETA|nr:DNA packaging protein UL33 [Aotine betaherpesvirus 1]AEV80757.1 DNA packaging protein UL33 [Aotine betaherpesvirus 1]